MTLQQIRRGQRYRAAVVAAVFLLIMMLLNAALPVSGQTGIPEWDTPLYLGDGWWESIAIDLEGTVHLAWYGGRGEYDVLSYRQRTVNGVWSEESDVLLTVTGGYTVRNALATTSDGMLYAAYRHETYHRFSAAPIHGALSAANWRDPLDINGAGYYIALTADRNDTLHLAYAGPVGTSTVDTSDASSLESDPCAFCSDLIYLRSTNGGRSWSNPRNMSNSEDAGSQRQTFVEGGSGRLYLTWDEGFDWYVGRGLAQGGRFEYSDDGGVTWSDEISLLGNSTTPATFPIQFSLTELPGQQIMAVWRYSNDIDRNIYYQISGDGGNTWTDPRAVPFIISRSINDTPLDRYELITDLTGGAHLFAVGYNVTEVTEEPLNAALYHLEYRQGAWRTVRLISYSPDYRPEWPEAVVGPSNELHLTWFGRTINEDGIDWKEIQTGERGLEVFYNYRPGTLLNGATRTFQPTQAPPPTATSVLAFQPTVTPFPTVGPINPATYTTRDNYGAQVVVVSMGATVLLCAGVLFAYGFRMRR